LAFGITCPTSAESNEYFDEVYAGLEELMSKNGVPDVLGGYSRDPFWNSRIKCIFRNNLPRQLPFEVAHFETLINLVMRTAKYPKHFTC